MADLDACYFCGAPDDLGEYAVVPDRYVRAGADQRRVVLCSDCRMKLTRVVRPLADRLDEAVGGDDDGDDLPDAGPTADAPTGDDPAADAQGVTIPSANPGVAADEGGDGDGGESEAGNGPRDGSRDAADATPDHYRTVMRLLSNRQFPVDREEVAVVARNAYDVTEAELNAVLSHAEAAGDLVVDGDQVRRP
ncbi:MAG: hypothetical protein ABEJ79_11210 [Halolamina sp.]